VVGGRWEVGGNEGGENNEEGWYFKKIMILI